jgi:hypothetical protein
VIGLLGEGAGGNLADERGGMTVALRATPAGCGCGGRELRRSSWTSPVLVRVTVPDRFCTVTCWTSMYIYVVRQGDGSSRRYLSILEAADIQQLGGLRAEAIVGEVRGDDDEIDPSCFIPNEIFLRFLNYVIARHVTACPGLLAEVARQGTGYVYLSDLRAGRGFPVPVEDRIGYVEIAGGEIKKYVGFPSYRPYTEKGFMQLDPWIHDRLVEELRALPR